MVDMISFIYEWLQYKQLIKLFVLGSEDLYLERAHQWSYNPAIYNVN